MASYNDSFRDFDDLFDSINRDFFNSSSSIRRGDNGNFETHYYQNGVPVDPQQSDLMRQQMAQQQVQQQQGQQKEQEIGIDLVEEAKNNKYDPVIGRDAEIDQVIEILSRRNKNNPVLTGPAGVGKTAIVEGLAQRIVEGKVPAKLLKTHIVEININDLVAGSSLRGSFEEKIKQIIDQASENPDMILFIDEIHNIVGAGSTDSDGSTGDAANILKPALARGDLKLIGATTTAEYQKIEHDPALERRFQPVAVGEPTDEQAIKILEGLAPKYEEYHHVKYSKKALEVAVTLSKRYIHGRYLPDKAIDLIDEAGAKKSLNELPKDESSLNEQIQATEKLKDEAVANEDFNKAQALKAKIDELTEQLTKADEAAIPEVTERDIYKLIEQKTKIPMSEIHEKKDDSEKNLAEQLKTVVIDQDNAIDIITDAIARKKVFKDDDRPTGSFLLAGPTGVGKTELAKQLAISLFGSQDHLIRLDMSEYQDTTAVNKLIGSAPGYIGYQEGGQLTEKVRHQPYSLILLDEIEKAHPDVFNALLQIMDDGRLTDSQGRTVSFKDTILIMTSNAGYSDGLINENTDLTEALSKYFRPEFLNRLDAIVPFNQLKKDDLYSIVDLYLDKMKRSLEKREIQLSVAKGVKAYLVDAGFDEKFGARPLRRVVEQRLETPAAKVIIDNPKIKKIDFTADNNHILLNGKAIIDLPEQQEEKIENEVEDLAGQEEAADLQKEADAHEAE